MHRLLVAGVAGAMALTGLAAEPKLVYHSTLDSLAAITSPKMGPAGTVSASVTYVDGKVGKAIKVPARSNGATASLPKGFLGSAGTIECWARIDKTSAQYGDTRDPVFYDIGNSQAPVYLYVCANDGVGHSGICAHTMAGNTLFTKNYTEETGTYASLFTTGDAKGWHHYAVVWDKNGIEGVGKACALYVDGLLKASTTWAGDGRVSTFANTVMPMAIGAVASESGCSIDEFKIWDGAKTTFDLDPEPVSDTPVINPESGTTFDQSLTISMTCAGDGATIHYTTNGTTPTIESPVYKKFRIWSKTTIKAMGFYLDGSVTEMAVSHYAKGLCTTPVISAASTFTGTKNKVSLSCETDGATIYYTMDGSDPTVASAIYEKPFCVSTSCTIKAVAIKNEFFDSDVAVLDIARSWSLGDTLGAPDHAFETSGDQPFSHVDDVTLPRGMSAKSGSIGNNQQSVLSTTVYGPGTLSFKWKTSCEEDALQDWDHAEFTVDGNVKKKLDGITDWIEVSQRITGDGAHAITWSYTKDGDERAGEDCMWVADYSWATDYDSTKTTDVPVPYTWLKEKCCEVVDDYESYEKVANQLALNNRLTVEQCYVAGVNPESSTNDFSVIIEMKEGKPHLTWDPDLKAARIYKLWGSETLEDGGSWQSPTNNLHKFFRVTVDMPE